MKRNKKRVKEKSRYNLSLRSHISILNKIVKKNKNKRVHKAMIINKFRNKRNKKSTMTRNWKKKRKYFNL